MHGRLNGQQVRHRATQVRERVPPFASAAEPGHDDPSAPVRRHCGAQRQRRRLVETGLVFPVGRDVLWNQHLALYHGWLRKVGDTHHSK